MSAPDLPMESAPGDDLDERVRRDASDLAETARHDLEDVGNEIKHQAADIGHEAQEQLAHATEKAKSMADEQKNLLADQLGGVSSAIDKVAGELEANGDGSAQYLRMIADGANNLTSTVRDNNVDDIVGLTEDFGRKQPVAFMGAAALLGFVASRFMMASASRRGGAREQNETQPASATQPYTPRATSGSSSSYSTSLGGNDAGL